MHPATDAESADAPLLISKLAIPPTPSDTVERRRLFDRLDAAATKKLTIVEAPAGWGKTLLLASWAGGAARRRPVAWLTAEADDGNDGFWRYLTTALTAAGGALPTSVSRTEMRTRLMARVAHGLARLPAPVTVIVDNLHEVWDEDVHDGLDYLLRHAGGNLRMILATRAEPPMWVHRWRVRDELTEIGPAELAYTAAETAEVVSRAGLALSEACLRDLHRRTEGWPAGVRLATLTMNEVSPARRFGAPGGDDPRIGDYLLAEVLDGQPGDLQEALLDASILDTISSDLLNALTGRPDGQRLLVELSQRGAFVTPVDRHRSWYRLHPLFGESLRGELRRARPTRIRGLHARAAAWFADHNLATDALRHALASEDRQLASSIVSEQWPNLLPYGHRGLSTVETSVPVRSAARNDPLFALAHAIGRLENLDSDGAEPYLRLAEDHRGLVPAESRDRFALAITAFRLAQAQLRGDVPATTALAVGILSQIRIGRGHGDRPLDDGARAVALTALGTAQLVDGQLAAAVATLREGNECAVAAGLPCPGLLCLSRLAFTHAMLGELTAAERAASAALDQAPCPGQTEPVHRAHAYLALAAVDLQRDRIEEASSTMDLAVGLFDARTDPALAPTVAAVRAQLLTERGEWGQGHDTLLAVRHGGYPSQRTAYLDRLLAATEAELLTALGDPGAARQLLRPARENQPFPPELAVAYARACLRERDHRSAARSLPVWSDADETGLPLPLRVAAGLIQAQASRESGDGRGAARALERALQLAEPEHLRRPFTGTGAPHRDLLLEHLESGTAHWSFLTDLLGAGEEWPGRRGGPPSSLAEPLTERELTVLRYLQSILSNVDIAAELSLSVNTVKTHVRNIYRKLSASHRRDAVRRARELQLL